MSYFLKKKALETIQTGNKIFYFLSCLPYRVFERVKRIQHNRLARLPLQTAPVTGLTEIGKNGTIWSGLAAPPGLAIMLPANDPGFWKGNADVVLLDELFQHKLRILSPAPFDLDLIDATITKKIRDLAKELPKETVDNYVPIDWHKDFRSGYRWDVSSFFS